MKLSEAEAKIHEYLVRNSIQEISPSQILDLVEKIGMKPPLNPRMSSLGMNFGLKIKCSWEPEDGK